MPPAPVPTDEAARLAALNELHIMDTPPDPVFDAIVQAASLVCGVPISLICLLDEDRQWFKAQVGLAGVSETARDEALCAYTILGEDLLEVRDARDDIRFSENPLVTGSPDIRFYAGLPLKLPGGKHAGTLCVIDSEARTLDDNQRAILRCLAVAASNALETWSAKRQNRLAEDILAHRRQRIDDLVTATNVGTWEWHIQSGVLKLNERYGAIFGFAPEDLTSVTADTAFAAVHPDDLPALRAKITSHLAGQSQTYDHEFRMLHRDGQMVWVRSHGRVMIWAADGTPEWMFGTVEDISVRKQQEIALTKMGAFLEQTGRMAGVGGWELDLTSGVIAWSAESYRIHGVSLDFKPTLDTVLEFFAAEARPALEAALGRAAAGQGGWDLEFPFVQATGNKLWVRTVGSAVFEDGKLAKLVGAIQDVTEHVAQRRALEAANERVTIATEAAGIGIWEWDLEVDTIFWENRMYGLYGKRPSEGVLTYESWLQCVHPDDRDRVDHAARTACEGLQPYDVEFRIVLENGGTRVVHAQARSYDDQQGRVRRLVGVNWDITEARLLEAERDERERELLVVNTELERAARHLVKARDEADRANRAKSHFLAGLSHELRTPLNGVLGYAQLLQMEGGLNAVQGERLASMLSAGTHLLGMINSVLELSEIESDHVELRLIEVDLSKVALAGLDLVRPRANSKGLRLTFSSDLDAPHLLVTDQMRLRQIVLNLLGNAVKFTDSGEVELRLRAIPNRALVRIEVADTGPGIKPDQRERLFKDFERLDDSRASPVEGAGLGLALSSRLASLLGGHIGYEDNPGGGSVFWVELPLDRCVAPPCATGSGVNSTPTTGDDGGAESASYPRLRILVVDDVAMNRDIACSFLRVAGHDTTCAGGGAEAVAAVLSGGIDVVLMDIRMPEVDGLEATRRIRRLASPAGQVPIIGLTAQAFSEQVLACTQAGMDGHVSKPYTPEALRDAVMQAAALGRERIGERRPCSTPVPSTAAELPVVNPETVKGLAQYLTPPVIDTYLRTIVTRCQSVLESLGKPDVVLACDAALAEAAHTLAGSAGMLGFTRLADDGTRLEHALRARSPEVRVLAGRMAEAIEVTLQEVDRLFRSKIA